MKPSTTDGVAGEKALPQADPKAKFAAHGVQRAWLEHAHGRPVRLHLMDGTVLSGTLLNHDMYCLALQQPGDQEPTLLFKHGVAYLTREA